MTAPPAPRGAIRARIIQPRVISVFFGSPGRRPFFPAARRARRLVYALLLALAAAPLRAQAPSPASPTAALGFTYTLPAEWKDAPTQSTLPAARQNAMQSAKNPGQELGVACAQVVLSAQTGKPPSVIVIVALPFPCYGQPLTAKELPRYAAGVSDEIGRAHV